MDNRDIVLISVIIIVVFAITVLNMNYIVGKDDYKDDYNENFGPIGSNAVTKLKTKTTISTPDTAILGNNKGNNKVTIIPPDPNTLYNKTTYANVRFPDDDQIVTYDTLSNRCSTPTMNPSDSTNEVPKQNTGTICKNKSLNDESANAYKYMIENSQSVNELTFPICWNYERNIIGDNLYTGKDTIPVVKDMPFNAQDTDIMEFYRKRQIFVKSYLEDPVVRGGNIEKYDKYLSNLSIGNISLEREYPNPKPDGFIFKDSAAFK